MTAGTPLLIAKEITLLCESTGILLPDGNFDQAKLDSVSENLELVVGIESILKQHGLVVPEKVDKIIATFRYWAKIIQ